jgi:RimJ/RimL family protein N-acetyltransferase
MKDMKSILLEVQPKLFFEKYFKSSRKVLRLYKKINKIRFTKNDLSLVPIRDEDKYAIRNWRNDQMDVLRQESLLTLEEQEAYFENVISKLFEVEEPTQFIFSLLEKSHLIGYGGLVHIDWKNKTAEISFLSETSRSKTKDSFIKDWVDYLSLVKEIANIYLNFNSIYTYAYDLRPNLYIALEKSGFSETRRLKDHVEINGEKRDVVIHTFLMNPLTLNFASTEDIELYYRWANDPEVRKFSFQQSLIKYEDHVIWFNSKINDPQFKFYLFKNANDEPVGQVRISRNVEEIIIGISIDANHRGHGYGTKILLQACSDYFKLEAAMEITAYIKKENIASIYIFKKAGFSEMNKSDDNETDTLKLILRNERF